MDDDDSTSSFIDNAPNEIEEQFQDLVESSSKQQSAGTSKPVSEAKKAPEGPPIESAVVSVENEDPSQDWEWVEETEYIVLDFGSTNYNAKDMENMTKGGYSLVGLETPTPYFKAGIHAFKGFYDENAITEDLLFKMKGHEEHEEGMDESDDENSGAMDLMTIATKRIMFESVDIVPITPEEDKAKEAQDKGKGPANAENQGDEAPVLEPRKEVKMTIWRAAYDAVGLDRRKKKKQPPAASYRGKRGRILENQGESSSTPMDIDTLPTAETPGGDYEQDDGMQ
ncbi:hypothetical protein BC939DRAFT_462184 [Gamsiella multidivaricata]|uniref:uncharacterized protein n=1 Tax=Gamsiella multidivaricata TaxID=101098 RepID=UPI00221EF303|nr:uncharacterized protein BC939DRAFT_462184 [Gamsiella multidivaricata]KAG0367259.1 hypothetical protein BGZ54_004152 [Gamsiella multidivaricata]KAI7818711.1 hypothetical protein BC939DRAFT_462184 [Gamsiella multidivaricata]